MGDIHKDLFVCLDIEATGLDLERDQIIEIAAAKFNFDTILNIFESLVDPKCPIPRESQKIHHISSEMVQGKPTIQEILIPFLSFIDTHILVGHGISFDIAMIMISSKRHHIPCNIYQLPIIDTLRMARLYGESSVNSLEQLRRHFNIPEEITHRAMSDVMVNIQIFKHLSAKFKTTHELLERLKKPILLKRMPLGKYKGRTFEEIPIDYLSWAARLNFDQDLLYSIRNEINKRKKRKTFNQATNPFSFL